MGTIKLSNLCAAGISYGRCSRCLAGRVDVLKVSKKLGFALIVVLGIYENYSIIKIKLILSFIFIYCTLFATTTNNVLDWIVYIMTISIKYNIEILETRYNTN